MSNEEKLREKLREFLNQESAKIQAQVAFAETKNTVLLAFNGAAIAGAITAFVGTNSSPEWYKYTVLPYAINVFVWCSFSLFYCLAAMYAQRHQSTLASRSMIVNDSDNIAFWGSTADNKDSFEYLKKVVKAGFIFFGDAGQKFLELDQGSIQKDWKYESDLAENCVVLAQIARRKYNYFNRAVLWTMSALLTPISLIVRSLLFNPDLYIIKQKTITNYKRTPRLRSLRRL